MPAPTPPLPYQQTLRARRKELGLSLRLMARQVGLSPAQLSMVETGQRQLSLGKLILLHHHLGLSGLVGAEDMSPPSKDLLARLGASLFAASHLPLGDLEKSLSCDRPALLGALQRLRRGLLPFGVGVTVSTEEAALVALRPSTRSEVLGEEQLILLSLVVALDPVPADKLEALFHRTVPKANAQAAIQDLLSRQFVTTTIRARTALISVSAKALAYFNVSDLATLREGLGAGGWKPPLVVTDLVEIEGPPDLGEEGGGEG